MTQTERKEFNNLKTTVSRLERMNARLMRELGISDESVSDMEVEDAIAAASRGDVAALKRISPEKIKGYYKRNGAA